MKAFSVFMFLMAPFFVGCILSIKSVSDILFVREPEALEFANATLTPSPKINPKLKTVLIVTSNRGTQIFDLLSAYDVFGKASGFQIFTVAEKRALSPTTGKLDFLPDFTFEQAPQADILVIPAILDPGLEALKPWLRRQTEQAQQVISLSEGARALAEAGLLNQKKAATHFYSLDAIKDAYPQIEFTNSQFHRDGKITTSAGIALAPTHLKHALENNFPTPETPHPYLSLGLSDYFLLAMNAGFYWVKKDIGIFISNGISESHLAALLEIYPRSFICRIASLGSKRALFKTEHGLTIVPSLSLDKSPPLDELWVLDRKELDSPELQKFRTEQEVPLLYSDNDSPLRFHLSRLTSLQSRATSKMVAKLMEYPSSLIEDEGPAFPFLLLLRPLLVGLLGLGFGRFFYRTFVLRKG